MLQSSSAVIEIIRILCDINHIAIPFLSFGSLGLEPLGACWSLPTKKNNVVILTEIIHNVLTLMKLLWKIKLFLLFFVTVYSSASWHNCQKTTLQEDTKLFRRKYKPFMYTHKTNYNIIQVVMKDLTIFILWVLRTGATGSLIFTS